MPRKRKGPKVYLEENGIPNSCEFATVSISGGWSFEKFSQNFRVEVVKESDDGNELEVDLICCSAAFANALRRILLSEVPSMAIEKVIIFNNTTILQDEVLSHRLGLIPLKADARLFEYLPNDWKKQSSDEISALDQVSDSDTLKYELKIQCKTNTQASSNSQLPKDIYINSNVYTSDIKWIPIGNQESIYPGGEKELGVIDDKILLAKMKPKQEIDICMYAFKGVGKDHAKFSPVATASYRMLPEIKITKPIRGKAAKHFQECFSPGVIEIVEDMNGNKEAKVKNARYDSCSRNAFMYDYLKDSVELTRAADHFIFTIESVGALPSSVLLLEAIKVLKGKCQSFLDELRNIRLNA